MDQSGIIHYFLQLANPEIARRSQKYFKTKKGQYGYGDIFLGLRAPVIREGVKRFKETPLVEIEALLSSKYHEIRFFSLLSMVSRFSKSEEKVKSEIVSFYLDNTNYINNWDLVDSSAHHILGPYLFERDRSVLYRLSKSKSLWDRRISIMTTMFFIKRNDFSDTLKIADVLLNDTEDLIHKAVGWMLREVGNKSLEKERLFLKPRYKKMPRTMLRYAIEKFEEQERKKYLRSEI